MTASSPVWYFDLISPFVHLQLELQEALFEQLQPLCRPVLFGVLLKHHGHLGPAEIDRKRTFTYRHVLWKAQQAGCIMKFPPEHPFRSLPFQRLCVGLEQDWKGIRELSRFIWQQGRLPQSESDWQDLFALRGWSVEQGNAHLQDPAVKQTLADFTAEALEQGVFGVPTFQINQELFWGEDAHSLMKAYLETPDLFEQEPFQSLADLPMGVVRRPPAS